jgi:plastocyanin
VVRKTKIITITLVAALFISVFAVAYARQSVPQNQPPKAVTVAIISDLGQEQPSLNYYGEFRPQAVAVAVGGTVTWNNTDNKDHTVVSYDGIFNQRLITGESFTYTFTQKGTYKYRDVLYDNMDGVVYVQ